MMKGRRFGKIEWLFCVAVAGLALGQRSAAHVHERQDGEGYPLQELDKFEFLESGDPLADWASSRAWTSTDGRELKAEVTALERMRGSFVLANGKTASIPLSKLSEEDGRFLAEWGQLSSYFNLAYRPVRDITGVVKAEMFDGAFAKEGKVHETRYFRFECDVPLRADLAKDFSRLFEVTHKAVESLPLALSLERPDHGKYLVRLFAEKDDYIKAGGKEQAAGIYILKSREILVPLSSLGLERGSNGMFRKTKAYDPATLIHETTHAVTHHWLNSMPMWLAEGLAEYIASMPYRDGTLDRRNHLAGMRARAAKKFGGDAEAFSLFQPSTFVHLGKAAFMKDRVKAEQPIVLKPVEPFQIKLVERGAKNTVIGGGSSVAIKRTMPVPPYKPLFAKPDTTVVRRYVSSMLLVHHLLESDPVAMRRYLFSLIHSEWDRRHYLEHWEETRQTHENAVQAQIAEFSAEYGRFRKQVSAFNKAVTRHNAGEVVTVPPRPVEPIPPQPIPVPEILAKPRSAEELSWSKLEKQVIGKHLRIPDRVALPE